MPNFTQVIVMGNLTRDPELRYLPAGTAVCDFTVAVNSSYTKEGGEKVERVDFYDITMWKRLAEVAAEYLKKGHPIFVSGQLQQDRWEDENGQKRSKVHIIGRQMQFLRSGSKDDESAAPAQEAVAAPQGKSNASKGQKGRSSRKPQNEAPPGDEMPF